MVESLARLAHQGSAGLPSVMLYDTCIDRLAAGSTVFC